MENMDARLALRQAIGQLAGAIGARIVDDENVDARHRTDQVAGHGLEVAASL